MDKPTPSTSVKHNDGYSKALIESYAQWRDGAGFQGSSRVEQVPAPGAATIEKPTEEDKVTTPIGTIPKPAFDTETIQTIKVVNTDDGGTKDPKFNAGPPDSTKNKPSYGAQIKNIMIKKEAKENFDAKQSELWDEASKILTELSELTETTYTVTGEKWEVKRDHVPDDGSTLPTPEVTKESAEKEKAYKAKAKKTAEKILSYSKK